MLSIRRAILLFLSIAAIAVGFAAYHFWGERYQIEFTEEQLIAKLAEKFPFNKTYLFIINLHLANPKLALEEGSDRLAFGCEIETKLKLEVNSEKGVGPLRGLVKFSGKLRYDPAEGTFFLDEPVVEDLDINGIPEKWQAKVNEAVSRAAKEFLSRAPIYRLRPTDFKKATARLILKNVKVVDRKLLITMGIG